VHRASDIRRRSSINTVGSAYLEGRVYQVMEEFFPFVRSWRPSSIGNLICRSAEYAEEPQQHGILTRQTHRE
jgi:hypothetical protein